MQGCNKASASADADVDMPLEVSPASSLPVRAHPSPCCVCWEPTDFAVVLHDRHGVCTQCHDLLRKKQVTQCPLCRDPINWSASLQLLTQNESGDHTVTSSKYVPVDSPTWNLMQYTASTAERLGIKHVAPDTKVAIQHLNGPKLANRARLMVNPLLTHIATEDGRTMTLLEYHMLLQPFGCELKDASTLWPWKTCEVVLKTWHMVHGHDPVAWKSSLKWIFGSFGSGGEIEGNGDFLEMLTSVLVDDDAVSWRWGARRMETHPDCKTEVENWQDYFRRKYRLHFADRVTMLSFEPLQIQVLAWMLRHPAHFGLRLRPPQIVSGWR